MEFLLRTGSNAPTYPAVTAIPPPYPTRSLSKDQLWSTRFLTVTFGIWRSLGASAIIVICAYETTRFAVLSSRPARHRRRHMGFSWIADLRHLNAPRLYLDSSAMAHMARFFFALRSGVLVQLRHKPSPPVEKGRRSAAGDCRRTRDDVLAAGQLRGLPDCHRLLATGDLLQLHDPHPPHA